MDIRVRETQLCTLNGKVEGVPVFFLDVRYEHWRWDVIRSFAEIELFHSNVTKILKKDQVPEFPSGDTDPEELKVLMGGYFSELVALPHLEKELASFIGQSTATAECKPLDKPITQEGYLNVISDELNQDGKIPVFCLIVEDTLYIFNNRVIIGKAYSLPLNSLELYEAQISKEDNKVLIDGTVGTCELICKTSEIAEKWYSAVKSATEHESSELENELNAKQHSALAELSTAFPKAEEKELVRFLQSNAWNVDQCVAVYKAHIQWRNDTRIDELKISSVYHILSSGRAVYTKNKDKKGRPILYFRARLHDPTENFMDTYLIAMYLMDKMIEDAGDARQIVVINDLNGFEKKNNDFRMNKLILEMVLAHYPNRVGAIWCTSTPWLFRMLFRVIKPWLGDELVSHVHLFGGTSELKEFVDENELLTDFGGTVDESKFQEWAKERAKKEGVSLDKPETHQFGNEEIVAAFSDAPVEHSAEGCIFEGWLKKQGGFVKKFNKRYCILKGTILYYYRTQKDLKADGVVFLRGARLLADQSSTFHIITSGGKDCIFQLYDKKQTQWLKVLENVILKNGGSIGHDDANIESVDPVDSFGITWQPKKESKKSKKSSSYLDELYFMFSDKSLRSFTMGRIPGNEIVSTIVKHTGKSREQAVEVGESWLHNQFLFPLSSKSTTFSDTEEESFLFSFLSGTSVLNFIQITSTSAKSSPNKIIESLHSKLVQIIKSKLLPDGRIDCEAIRSSREYFDFIVATADLQLVSLDSVKDKETFFFNLRSLLLLHAQITHGIGTDCATRFKIFTTSQYCVGMNRFSAADITHGILRANSPAPESLISKHFTDKKDPRTKFCCKNSDERIILATPGLTLDPFHFSTSYQDTLAQATVQFVSDVSIVSNEVFVSQILMWVNTEDKLEFLSQFLPDHRKPPQSAVIAPYSVNWSKFGLGSLGNS